MTKLHKSRSSTPKSAKKSAHHVSDTAERRSLAKLAAPEKVPGWAQTKLELLRTLTVSKLREKGAPSKELASIGRRISLLEAGHRNRQYEELAGIYLIARFLEHDDDAWADICSDPIWEAHPKARPKVDNRTTALNTSLRLAIGPGSDQRKQVNLFKRALQGPFGRGIDPQAVPDLLRQEGGPQALASTESAVARVQKAAGDALLIRVPAGRLADRLANTEPNRCVRFIFTMGGTKNGLMEVHPVTVGRRKGSAGPYEAKPHKD